MKKARYENLEKYRNKLLPFICGGYSLNSPRYIIPHWHESIEFLYCIEGEGRVVVNGSNFEFSEGKTAIVNTNRIHSVNTDSYVSYKHIIIFEDFFKENGIDTERFVFDPIIDSPEMGRMFNQMHNDFKTAPALKTRLDAMELLYALQRNYMTEISDTKEAAVEGIKNAIHYINRNYAEDIRLETIADISNLSKFYFTKKFKEMTGRTYIDFLGNIRCQKAAELLKDGKTVSDVCFSVGYNDPAYFSRVFKKYMGDAPSKYV